MELKGLMDVTFLKHLKSQDKSRWRARISTLGAPQTMVERVAQTLTASGCTAQPYELSNSTSSAYRVQVFDSYKATDLLVPLVTIQWFNEGWGHYELLNARKYNVHVAALLFIDQFNSVEDHQKDVEHLLTASEVYKVPRSGFEGIEAFLGRQIDFLSGRPQTRVEA